MQNFTFAIVMKKIQHENNQEDNMSFLDAKGGYTEYHRVT